MYKMASMVQGLIGVMIAVLIGVTAVIPTITSSITTSNITGTTKTVLDVLPIVLAVAILLGGVALFA